MRPETKKYLWDALEAANLRWPQRRRIQRYKGLGEMNPEETMRDPNARSPLQVKTTHGERGEDVFWFSTFMGDFDMRGRQRSRRTRSRW